MTFFVKSKFRFFFLLSVLFCGAVGVATAEDVTFRVVNPDGDVLSGSKVGVGWPWTLQATPYVKDITLPNNTSIRTEFSGLWGSTTNFGNATKNISITSGRTVTFDFVSGTVISDEASGDGSTNFDVVVDAFQPTFGLVDLAGSDISGGQIVFPSFGNQTENTPYTPTGFVRNNWDVSVRGKLDGVETTTKVVTIKKDVLQRVDAQNVSQVTETPNSGARIDFQYGIFNVPVQTTDNTGTAIPGDVQVSGGGFQASPLTLTNQTAGAQIAVQGRIGATTSQTAVVRVHPDSTFNIALDGSVVSSYTPGDPNVNVLFQQVSYNVVVTDLSGNTIFDLDGSTVMGEVLINGETADFVASGYSGSILNGGSIGVKGRFDDLESALHVVQVESDKTVVISAADGVVSPAVSTPGQTRVELRFDPIVFTTEVVNELGINLDDALVRVVDYTDEGGVSTFVNSPFLVKIRAGNNLNIEVKYANYEEQFNINSVGGTVFLFDQNGDPAGTASTDSDKGGARASVDDAPVTIRTTNGTGLVAGQIKLGGGVFEDSPLVALPALDGDLLNIEAQYLGAMVDNIEVTVKEDVTQTILASTGAITEVSTPGSTFIDVVFAETNVELVVTDLNGDTIFDLDGTTVLGEVFINSVTPSFVPSGYVYNAISGVSLGVKARFDDLETGFLTAVVLDNHTTVINAADGVVSAPVSTPGVTRIEFRYDAIVFTTEVVNDLGFNLDDALVRVVDYTDVGGVPTFVSSPFLVKIRAGNNLNIEVQYASYQEQFDIVSIGGTVYLFDQNGDPNGTTTTDADKGGARAVVDDAPVTIRTTDGTDPVAGQIKLGGGTFEASPLVSILALDGDVINIEAQYNGILMDNTDVTVKEDVTQTVNAGSGAITEQSTPGTTLIDIAFSEMTVDVLATDLNGGPILDLDGTTVLGEVFVNGLTPDYVPSGYSFQAVSGQTFGFRGRFDDLSSEFQGIQVVQGKTVAINVATGTVAPPVDSQDGSTRIEMQFDPVVFTTDVLNDQGENLSIATVRLVNITDVGGQATFVSSPYLAVLRNGRLLNVEVEYGLFQTQFDLNVTGASIQEFNIDGQATGTSPASAGEGGARTIVDDAAVTIQTVEATNPVAGELNIELYTTLFEGSPVAIDAILDGTPLDIEARFNGVTMTTVTVNVTENHTTTVKAVDGSVGVPVSTPGVTVINIDFSANQAPVAIIAGDETQSYYCLANSMYLELDGTQSSDADGDSPLTYRWKLAGNVLHEGQGEAGSKPTLLLPVGSNAVTLEVEDPNGAIGADQVTIAIQNDTDAPVVAVIDPNDGVWVKGTRPKMSGTVTDNTKLKSVKIDGRTASFSGPNGNYNFTGTARLVAGENTVNVLATDFAGNEGTATLTLHADVKRPASDVENATLTPTVPSGAGFVNGFLSAEENEVQVKVNVALSDYNDDANTLPGSGVDLPGVMIGGQNVTLVSGDAINGVYEATVTLKGNGNKSIKVWVGDNVGHRLDSRIALKMDTRLPQARISSPSNNALVTTETVTVIGDAWDDGNANEVASIDVNGVAGAFTGNGREFRAENVTPNPDGSIVVTVTDLADKTNTASVVVNHQGGGGGVPASLKLTLISSTESGGNPIEGSRVDLLEVRDGNERGTGKRQNTNANGVVEFEVDGSKTYRMRVEHNRGKYTTGDMTATGNNDVTVQTLLSEFTFKSSTGDLLGDVRVDLMDGTGEHLCLKHKTTANGVAAFEILPGLDIRFRVHWMAAKWISPAAIPAGGDETLETKLATLTFTTSASSPIEGARVDLRNDTGDHLCKKENTDGNGVASFEVLPNMQYRFMVHYSGGNFLLANILSDGQDDTMQTVLSSLTLNDHNGTGNAIDGARVDLLREDERGVGKNVKTGQSGHGAGVAGFEVLPGFVHKFKVSYNGGSYITASVTP